MLDRPTPEAASPLPLKGAPPAAGQSPLRGGRLALLWLLGALVAPSASAQDTEAEVRKIDKPQMRITLKHAEIKKLDMPPMTMVFRIKDAKLFDGLNVGDKIMIAADQIDGHYTVTAIQKKP
jgi:Cu(I)/Ag(I) efflux system periplasmic protein CusF